MNNTSKSITLMWDLVFLTGVSILALFLISFYFKADFLATGYPDWMVHAFRVKSMEQYGLSSWTHVWSNGIALWRSYQFIPHIITLALAKIAQVDIPRAMVLMTIGQYVLLRVFIYLVLRLLKFSPISALVCTVLSFDIGQYWGGVGDYSLMFAFTFFPFVFLLWTKYVNGHIQYVFPYIAGLLFYVHPMLGLASVGLMVSTILFSSKNILSLPIISQIGVFLASSSLFWYPVVFKASYAFSSPAYANKYFLNLALSRYDYYGLSLFLFICLFTALFHIFMPHAAQYKWLKILMLFTLGYIGLIFIGLHIDLPKAISQIQFTRGTTIAGLCILFAFAPVIEKIKTIPSLALKGFLLFLLSLAVIEGMWFSTIYSAQPGRNAEEPITKFITKQHNTDVSQARVWTSTIDTTSYFAPLTIKLPYSYMNHLDSNQIPQRIAGLLVYHPYLSEIPESYVERIDDYFKISGTKYVFFEETSPFTQAFIKSKQKRYKDLGTISMKDTTYHVFETKDSVKNAAIIDTKYIKTMEHFPFTIEFANVNDETILDDYVKKFVTTVYKPENSPLAISYPTQTSVQVAIPEKRRSNVIYLNESYDNGWKAYFNNKEQPIFSTGPNFMLVYLDSLDKGGTLILQHNWPLPFYISLYLIFLIPIEITIFNLLQKTGIFRPKKRLMHQL